MQQGKSLDKHMKYWLHLLVCSESAFHGLLVVNLVTLKYCIKVKMDKMSGVTLFLSSFLIFFEVSLNESLEISTRETKSLNNIKKLFRILDLLSYTVGKPYFANEICSLLHHSNMTYDSWSRSPKTIMLYISYFPNQYSTASSLSQLPAEYQHQKLILNLCCYSAIE